MKCDVCGKDKKTTKLEPSRSQLIVGGFPVKYEKRCQQCETKLCKRLDKLLKNI